MKVFKTTNYGLFKTIKGNRVIDSSHLKKLLASISKRNMLAEHPIVVNNIYKVIDGQHRLEVAQELQLPIYYTVVDKGGLDEVIMLNNAQKNWSLYDYLESFITRENANYITLKEFITQYSLPVTVGVTLLTGSADRKAMEKFKNGDLEVVKEKEAYEIGQMLVEYRRYANSDIYRSRDFVKAVTYMYENKPVPHFQMIQKLVKTEKKIERRGSMKEYLRELEEMYNFHRQSYIRFFGEMK